MKRFKKVLVFGLVLGILLGTAGEAVLARSPVFFNRNEEYSLDVSGSLSKMQIYGLGLKYQYKPHTYLTFNQDFRENGDSWTGLGLQNRFQQDFYGWDFYAGAGLTYIKSNGNFNPYLLSGVGFFVFFLEYELVLGKTQPDIFRYGLRLNF
ncbi:MAG: hypothetical protein ACM3TT_14010 [Syntrophothermus sp.]